MGTSCSARDDRVCRDDAGLGCLSHRKDAHMLFGLTTFTLIHVVLSLVGIFTGLVVAGGFIAGKQVNGWTGVFLVTTTLTSVTGFGFPFTALLPSHVVGIISLAVVAVVLVA